MRARIICYEYFGSFRGVPQWTAFDENLFDGESPIGHGATPSLALLDLIEQEASTHGNETDDRVA